MIDLCSAELSSAPTTSTSVGTSRPVNHVDENYPILCNVYKDPDNQFQKVVLIAVLPGGSTNSRIELSDDGLIAYVKYS